MSKKEVAEKANTSMAAFDYGSHAAEGFENQTQEDLKIPFLSVLQSNSPQCDDENFPDARPGMIFNSVTEELADGKEGVVFVPATTDHVYTEWVPIDDGGGQQSL